MCKTTSDSPRLLAVYSSAQIISSYSTAVLRFIGRQYCYLILFQSDWDIKHHSQRNTGRKATSFFICYSSNGSFTMICCHTGCLADLQIFVLTHCTQCKPQCDLGRMHEPKSLRCWPPDTYNFWAGCTHLGASLPGNCSTSYQQSVNCIWTKCKMLIMPQTPLNMPNTTWKPQQVIAYYSPYKLHFVWGFLFYSFSFARGKNNHPIRVKNHHCTKIGMNRFSCNTHNIHEIGGIFYIQGSSLFWPSILPCT